MKTQKATAEPSMEDILASIRTIISGEEKEGKKHSFESADILDLTDFLPEEMGPSAPLKRSQEAAYSLNKGTNIPHTSKSASTKKDDLHDDFYDYLKETSGPFHQTTLSESSQSLHTLKTLVQKNPSSFQPPRVPGETSQTLETLVCDLLKPLLKEWLDANLSSLVQKVINEHIERMMRELDTASYGSSQKPQDLASPN